MKLARFVTEDGPRIGAVVGDKVVDLQLGLLYYSINHPDAKIRSVFPFSTITDILVKKELLPLLNDVADYALKNEPSLPGANIVLDLSKVALRPPIPAPGKVVCVALNYVAHAAESKNVPPDKPYLFLKPASTSFVGHGDKITLPNASKHVTHEVELAAIIGKRGKHIEREKALEYVGAYTIYNDMSLRDISRTSLPTIKVDWVRGKVFDASAPNGPWVVTADEIKDPHNLRLTLRVNGEVRQDGNTRDMIFDVCDLIAFISETMTLEPGDMIATGTPAGATSLLNHGDIMEAEIEQIGVLTNYLASEE